MRKSSIALLTSVALAVPTAAFVMPAEAAQDGGGVDIRVTKITDCKARMFGETVRVRIRDEGRTGKVRVSHRRGKGVMKQRDVKRVSVSMHYMHGEAGGARLERHGNDWSFRTSTRNRVDTDVLVKFKLRDAKIRMSCPMR